MDDVRNPRRGSSVRKFAFLCRCCGCSFRATRCTATYCSPRCRKAMERIRKKVDRVINDPETRRQYAAWEKELLATIPQAG